MNYLKRIHKARTLLHELKVDALFITDAYSILYFTGFKTASPHEMEVKAILTQDTLEVITDARYEIEAGEFFDSNNGVSVHIQTVEKPIYSIIEEITTTHGIKNLGFESHNLTYQWYEYLKKHLSDVSLVSIPVPFVTLRNIKDQDELTLMRKAAKLSDECLESILHLLRVGSTEKEVYSALEGWVHVHDLSFSFDPIVAIDSHAALPHYNNQKNNGSIEQGSVVLIDMGILYNNYCSDITRMFFIDEPSEEIKKAYQDLLTIQEKTIESIGVGVKMSDIDVVARVGLTSKGYPSIPHSTGHGIGLEVHEGMRISKNVDDIIQNGMVFTIEPGIYHPGKWGMRVEDTVAVVDSQVEVLTKFPKNLTVL